MLPPLALCLKSQQVELISKSGLDLIYHKTRNTYRDRFSSLNLNRFLQGFAHYSL